MTLQTREQHIRREKATSNICTAQVLLAVMAGMYAVYHGREGLRSIAQMVASNAALFAKNVSSLGFTVDNQEIFDTVVVRVSNARKVLGAAESRGCNLRILSDQQIGVSFDETSSEADVAALVELFRGTEKPVTKPAPKSPLYGIPANLERKTNPVSHPIFEVHHSETEMLRYIKSLEAKDLSLCQAMIPLGSCTMKLNAASEMFPVSWPEFANMHPFAPAHQTAGYRELFLELEAGLAAITGFDKISLQPNAGSQGEYAGLIAIREYHRSRGDLKRTVCLVPVSAHGTNPASAAMAGMEVVIVKCDAQGNVELGDLEAKAAQHAERLAAVMVTYPSTHGVFEEGIIKICEVVHRYGGQVYMDGANYNALVGVCSPATFGVDVGHLNLHKTFCIPHGGGGPGMGPIGVKAHLAPFLPGHPIVAIGIATIGKEADAKIGATVGSNAPTISAAPWGSSLILVIPWMYIAMMGSRGLTRATEVAILSANYLSKKLESAYPTVFRGASGFVAHECIIDMRDLKRVAGIEVDDVAKRLMDYGFHAPTVSWPVAGTMMIEPTESEPFSELNRFIEAMQDIRSEISAIESGKLDRTNNPLKNAPHTAQVVVDTAVKRPYAMDQAVFPSKYTRQNKFWPAVGRVDASYGDRNVFCTCPPITE